MCVIYARLLDQKAGRSAGDYFTISPWPS
jgi:hypothetical protein